MPKIRVVRRPTARKPRRLTAAKHPLVEVREHRIWIQATPRGKWEKVPVGRARYIADRLTRAIRYIKKSA